eukprot:539469_1
MKRMGKALLTINLMIICFFMGTMFHFPSLDIDHTDTLLVSIDNMNILTNSFNISDTKQIDLFLQSQTENIILNLPSIQSQQIYCKYYNVFCNGCDFGPIYSIANTLCANNMEFSMFIVGANYGQATKNVLNACSDGNKNIHPHIYAFEAIPYIYESFNNKYHKTKNIRIYNNAVSDKYNQNIEVYSDLKDGRGGVNSDHLTNETESGGFVRTTTFDHILQIDHKNDIVDYVLIDVEGYEVNVVKGMKLEENYKKFPMFQIELGGTWADTRHSTYWSQGDMVSYLDSIGYDLFLLGGDKSWTEWVDKEYGFDVRGKSKLLRVYPEMFMKKSMLKGDSGYSLFGQEYVQGNLLVVHLEYIRQEFKDILFKLIRNLQIEMFNHMK